MTDNILPMPQPLDRLGDRIDSAFARAQHGREEWIEGTLELAVALADAREMFQKDDRRFGVWLIENGHNHLGDHDRAALIRMAADPTLARIALENTERDSYQHIWEREAKPMFAHREQTSPSPISPAELQEKPQPEPEKQKTSVPEKTTSEPEPEKSEPRGRAVSRKSPFVKLKLPEDEIALLYEYMLSNDARTDLAKLLTKKANQPLWALLMESIRSGTYGQPSNVQSTGNVRMLFPWLAPRESFGQQDLTKPHVQKFVRSYVMPLILENASLIRPDGTELSRLAAQRRAADENRERERLRMEQHREAAEKLPADEQEVVAYGTYLWPQVGEIRMQFTYDELVHAVWYWQFFLGIVNREYGPRDVGISIRHLTKYLMPLQPGFVHAIGKISRAYEESPTGDSKFPRTPNNWLGR